MDGSLQLIKKQKVVENVTIIWFILFSGRVELHGFLPTPSQRHSHGQRRVGRDRLWDHGLPIHSGLRRGLLPGHAGQGLAEEELQEGKHPSGHQSQ